MALLQMDQFIYDDATAHRDFPLYAQRFELFLTIQNIGFCIITPDPNSNPPTLGETTMKALHFLLHLGGPKILEIYNASAQPLNYVTFKAILMARFSIINPQIADFHFRSAKQFTLPHVSKPLQLMQIFPKLISTSRS